MKFTKLYLIHFFLYQHLHMSNKKKKEELKNQIVTKIKRTTKYHPTWTSD